MQDFPGFEDEYYKKHGIDDPVHPETKDKNKDSATDKAAAAEGEQEKKEENPAAEGEEKKEKSAEEAKDQEKK